MKKINIPCVFGGNKQSVPVFIGHPDQKHHPLHFQSEWLSKERGGAIPEEVMNGIQKLKDLAEKNGVSFEELCEYALTASTIEDKKDKAIDEKKD